MSQGNSPESLRSAPPRLVNTYTGSSHSETSEPDHLPTNYQNRQAAARLRKQLRGAQKDSDSESESDEELPDIGSLEISPRATRKHRHDMPANNAVTFSGRSTELKTFLLHVKVQLLADGTDDTAEKAGFLAARLRGSALNWLAIRADQDESILSDYEELVAALKQEYELDPETQKLQSAEKLTKLTQRGKASEYVNTFNKLASDAGVSDDTKRAFFLAGLNQQVKNALITQGKKDTLEYDELQAESIRLDSQFYHAKPQFRRSHPGNTRGSKTPRGKDGKFKPKVKTEYEY